MEDEPTGCDPSNEENSKPTPPRCGICEKAEAKYRCPGCLVRTCSLRCVLRHKTDRHCNGQRIKTAYVGIKDFTDANLRSDLHFLEESSRKVELTRKDIHKFDPKAANFRLRTFISNARNRGVDLLLMPNGMSRRLQNTSMYHFQSETILWRIEWRFPQENLTFIDDGFSDAGLIQDGVDCHIERHLQQASHHSSAQSALSQTSQPPPSKSMTSGSLASESLVLESQESESLVSKSHASASPVSESLVLESHAPESLVSKSLVSELPVTEDVKPQHEPSGHLTPEHEEEQALAGVTVTQPCPSLHQYSAKGGRKYRVFLRVHGLKAAKERHCVRNFFQTLCDYNLARDNLARDLAVHTRFDDLHLISRYYELDKTLSLQKNLQGKCIIEFPTLYIVSEEHAHSYTTLSADEERELTRTRRSTGQPYQRGQQGHFRGRGHRGRRRHRPQYRDADTYNPNSQIFKP